MTSVHNINKILRKNLFEDEDEEIDLFSDSDIENAEEGEGEEGEEESEQSDDTEDIDLESDESGDSGDEGVQDYSSDEEKVNDLFKDTGDPKIDYSLTNDNNIRLYVFKFKNSGIDPYSLMTKLEQIQGVRADDLESRLTQDQLQAYRENNKELRNKYELIKNREKSLIIYNANINFFINDENGTPKKITLSSDILQAIKKVIVYMDRNFGDDWVDTDDAIEFLQNIKINFSDKNKVRPNLLSVDYFINSDVSSLIPFNQMHCLIPQVVDSFIKENQDNDNYKISSIFRTFVDDFTVGGVGSSRTNVYPVIRKSGGQVSSDDSSDGEPETDDADGSGGSGGDMDFGGDIGGDEGDIGGDDEGSDDIGDDIGDELEL
jgi:hypothetical protein